MPPPFEVPILFCIFNRPELTERVFQMIAQQQPKRLLIAGDGPRAEHPNDWQQIARCREIVTRIDWDCEVQTLFADRNYGCRQQMARAITWGFAQQEQLIILEDDCLPHPDFFPFCQQLLDRYANDRRVMTICGISNLELATPYDYRFSKYPLIWGWASWRRAWECYDLEMRDWHQPAVQAQVLEEFTESPQESAYWRRIFQAQAAGEINTWDYSWTFASWKNRGLTICPRKNLVSNIGFGQQATHTTDSASPLADQPTYPLEIAHHPPEVQRDISWDRAADRYYFANDQASQAISPRSFFSFRKLKRLFQLHQS